MSYSSFSDVELAELLKTDDSVAYTVIYNRYFHALYVHAFQKLNDKQEAQDVVHELFAQLWNKRRELNISTNLMGYLYTGVRNKILDQFSRQQVRNKYINSLQGFWKAIIVLQTIESGKNSLPNSLTKVLPIYQIKCERFSNSAGKTH